ncbi:hypothetical protein EJV44_22435 [Ancylobacter aquaticus]|nr:hypothetical protein EJV44_22435 [Ancylobacter aquaticus]
MNLLTATLAAFREVGRACKLDTEAAKDGYLVVDAPELGVVVLIHRSIVKKRWLRRPLCTYHIGIGNVETGLWSGGSLGMDTLEPAIAFLNKAYTEAEDVMFAEYEATPIGADQRGY